MDILEQDIAIKKYDAYKDSGVEWLGEVPAHWEVKKLKFLGNMYSGLSGKTQKDFHKEYVEFAKPFIPFTNICNQNDIGEGRFEYVNIRNHEVQNRVLKNDILFLMSSETFEDIAKCAIYVGNDDEVYLNSFCKGFRPKFLKVNSSYLNYLLSSPTYKNYFMTCGRGFTRVNIRQDFINNAYAIVPDVTEQKAISQYLNEKIKLIEKSIDQKEKLIELLDEHKRNLIQQAITEGLNVHVRKKDSKVDWIGGIPAHWEVVSNRNIFSERNEAGNESLPILSVSIHTAVSNTELNEEENLRGKNRIEDKSSYKRVHVDDIAFNMMRAWQGAIGAVRVEGMVSPAYIVAQPKIKIDSTYFEYQYRTRNFIAQMDKCSKGITDFRKRLYWQQFKQLLTVVPPLNEQREIADFIQRLSAKTNNAIDRMLKEIRMLKEYKVNLINAAVTGKIKVC
jgi:type I restriction enzyme, S subunit